MRDKPPLLRRCLNRSSFIIPCNIPCDIDTVEIGALHGPSSTGPPRSTSTSKPIDSIAVSSHTSFAAVPSLAELQSLARKVYHSRKVYIDAVSELRCQHWKHGQYTFWKVVPEWQPSTSGMLFFAQRRLSGLQADVHPCLDASQYLCEKLRAAGQCQSKRASTVCLECPVDQGFIQRWRA